MDLKSSISKRERTIFSITILVISLSIIYSFILEPLYKEYTELNQEINTRHVQLAKNIRLLREKDIVRQEFKKYSHRLKVERSDEEEMATVLTEIEKIGNSTGIYLSDVKPQKIKDMDFYKVMIVEIRFQGAMQTLSKFIYELQNSALLLKASRLQINSKGAGQQLIEGVIQISRISIS
ncbi:type 4a pilus biogenesis protein PilO [Candidatus Omnitrophota bacterium]